MRRVVALVLFAGIACATSCDAFGRSAERLAATSPATSPSSVSSARAAQTAVDGLPPIVVEIPTADAAVANPLVIRGTANVDGGLVLMRLVAEDGSLISGVDATASCGTGCRGEFRVELHFFTERRREATLEVFGDSAADGSPVGVVRVPLTLFG